MPPIPDQNYSSLQEGNAKIISDIANLQKIEKSMFSTLEQNVNNKTLSDSDKQELIKKINELSQMRSNMYKTIGGLNNFYASNLSSSATTLAQQTAAIDVVENELNEAKGRLQEISDHKINKLRSVEINNYYGERYAHHSYLMKVIIFMFVPILILTLLKNYKLLPDWLLPDWLFSLLIGIIIFIGVIVISYTIFSMSMRDNMIYEEYNWNFDANSAPKASSKNTISDPWASNVKNGLSNPSCSTLTNPITCYGQSCCDTGYTYYAKKNKCLPTGTETFISDIFTKYAKAAENKKPDYTMGDKLPVSYAGT